MKSISSCKWLIQLKGIHPKVVRNLPGSKNSSGELTQTMSDLLELVGLPPLEQRIYLELCLLFVDPHIQHPKLQGFETILHAIFGPAQGSSCPSAYTTVFQVWSDK